MPELVKHIGTHVQSALSALTTPLRGKARMKVLVESFLAEVQEAEDSVFSVAMSWLRWRTATGATLDQVGKIVGARRDGLEDFEYRRIIAVQLLVNRSKGRIHELLTVLRMLTESPWQIRYHGLVRAAYQLTYVVAAHTGPAMRRRVKEAMLTMRPAGVSVSHVNEFQPGYFGFDEDDESLGFDDGQFNDIEVLA